MHQATFIGNATRDAVLKHSPAGHSLCTFTVAVNNEVNGERETIFMPVVAFGRQGQNCFHSVKKGTRVVVTGRMEENRWDDHVTIQLIAAHVSVSLQFDAVQRVHKYNHEQETSRVAKSLGMVWDGESWVQPRPQRTAS
jgi:single stranded DNA-binding protein